MEIRKNDSAIKISIVALHKLMTMSSYLINSNYIEPSFPPCDEYQQGGYLPGHGDYYERPKDPGFSHHDEATYPRSSYTDTGYDYGNVPAAAAGLDDFGDAGHHAQPQPVPQSHGAPRLSAAPDGGAGANKDCSLAGEVYPGVAKGKEPVVYPWMKKVHVNSGELPKTPHCEEQWLETHARANSGMHWLQQFTTIEQRGRSLRTPLVNFIAACVVRAFVAF